MEFIFPNGSCASHGPLLTVNGVAKCIKCEAKAAQAGKELLVNTVADPGHQYFEKAMTGVAEKRAIATINAVLPPTLAANPSYEVGLQEILGILSRIPMPSSMKQYKLLMSVKQKIEAALQEV